jgi:hypothetical protein
MSVPIVSNSADWTVGATSGNDPRRLKASSAKVLSSGLPSSLVGIDFANASKG